MVTVVRAETCYQCGGIKGNGPWFSVYCYPCKCKAVVYGFTTTTTTTATSAPPPAPEPEAEAVVNTGWICPACNRGLAPWVDRCNHKGAANE